MVVVIVRICMVIVRICMVIVCVINILYVVIVHICVHIICLSNNFLVIVYMIIILYVLIVYMYVFVVPISLLVYSLEVEVIGTVQMGDCNKQKQENKVFCFNSAHLGSTSTIAKKNRDLLLFRDAIEEKHNHNWKNCKMLRVNSFHTFSWAT